MPSSGPPRETQSPAPSDTVRNPGPGSSSKLKVPDVLSGQFGKYEIERLIGRGGMGAVYLARQTDLDRPVVVKVIAAELAREVGTVERLHREAKTAARVSSDHVVQVYETGMENGTAFIAMEYVDGSSAADLLKKKGKFGWIEATQLVASAAKGLGAAHAQGVLHRDVKPANILVAKDGRVKVADFGVAKFVVTANAGPKPKDGSLTGSGMIIGSPYYMAPEQADSQPIDARADIYALGVTYFELLTGRRPFEAETPIKTLSLVLSAPTPSPRQYVPELPPAVEKACLKLMAREKEDRPKSTDEVIQLLGNISALSATGRAPALTDGARAVRRNAPTTDDDIEIVGMDPPDHVSKLKDRLAKELPQYAIETELGRGGVGVVFKARHKPSNETVALKVLMAAELASSKQRARFEEEAQITKRINHPGIVPIRDIGTTGDGVPYFTMKYVQGEDFAALMRKPTFTREQGLEVLKEVALAVQAAHAQGVVHRDLKPENVLIEKTTGRPFVLDFGLAKSTEANEKKLTVTGALLGTPYYMSYEQALGRHREVDARTDVYALGAILYVILTGKPPFDADSAGELFAKIIKEEPPPPRRIRPDVPWSLERVALKALKKNKDERQPNAGVFAEELDHAIELKDAPPSDESIVFMDRIPSSGAGGYSVSSTSEDMFSDEVGGPARQLGPITAPLPGLLAPKPPAPANFPPAQPVARAPSGPNARVGSERVRATETPAEKRSKPSASSPDLVLDPARANRMRASSSSANLTIGTPSERVRRKDEKNDLPLVSPGAVISDWQVVESLGEEDGVRVFAVEKNGRSQVLREHPLPTQAAEDLTAYAERLSGVRHEDLEPLLDKGRSRAGAWYVVDDRATLRAEVAAKGPFSEADALATIGKIARVLAALKQRNVLHGDASPRNVLVDSEGQVRLASPVRVRNANAILGAGPITGDPRYAAPSVLDGQAPVAADDVFTLGLTFAFLLSAKETVPETEPVAAMIARSKLPGTVPDLAALVPSASHGAKVLYARMTEREPARRPEPAQLASDVETLLGQGLAPAAAPAKKGTPIPAPFVPPAVAIIAALVALALAVLAVGAALTTSFEDPSTKVRFTVPTDGR